MHLRPSKSPGVSERMRLPYVAGSVGRVGTIVRDVG
jgi:hypothetical protein